jgi:hypothetical protein
MAWFISILPSRDSLGRAVAIRFSAGFARAGEARVKEAGRERLPARGCVSKESTRFRRSRFPPFREKRKTADLLRAL